MRCTIARLKELIKELPDDALVLASGHDHSHRIANVEAGTAMFFEGGHICEDFGDAYHKDGVRKPALLIQ